MAQYGMFIGLALVGAATACAVLLGAKAAKGVAQFRAEEHESFAHKEQTLRSTDFTSRGN